MNYNEEIVNTNFYRKLNQTLRTRLPIIEIEMISVLKAIIKKNKFDKPLTVYSQFEVVSHHVYWRLEVDFDDYQWSYKTVKPHFLGVSFSLEGTLGKTHFNYGVFNSFNEPWEVIVPEKCDNEIVRSDLFVNQKLKEVNLYLDTLVFRLEEELELLDFEQLEYLEEDVAMNKKIQDKWNAGYVIGQDCITYGDGSIVIANTYGVTDPEKKETKRYWFPLCDTTLIGLERYDENLWSEIDIFHGSFTYKDKTIVFGDGAMGNEGYVASLNEDKSLNWSIFFTFSNPIIKAEIKDDHLICYGDTGCIITINMANITEIEVSKHDV